MEGPTLEKISVCPSSPRQPRPASDPGSSPYWNGDDTALASTRTKIFESLPTSGLPPQLHDWADFEGFMHGLLRAGVISSIREVWWDIRPHPNFPTLEFRICDCTTRVEEVIAIAAMVQALVGKLIDLRKKNLTWRPYRSGFVSENKWRAMKDGVQGKLIDLSTCDRNFSNKNQISKIVGIPLSNVPNSTH